MQMMGPGHRMMPGMTPMHAMAWGHGTPQGLHPGGVQQRMAMPGNMPHGHMPHGHMPHGPMPHGPMPHGHMPHGHMPHGPMPHGPMPHGPMPHGQMHQMMPGGVAQSQVPEMLADQPKPTGEATLGMSTAMGGTAHQGVGPGRSGPTGEGSGGMGQPLGQAVMGGAVHAQPQLTEESMNASTTYKGQFPPGTKVGTWESRLDPNTNVVYYVNFSTQQSQWEAPPEFAVAAMSVPGVPASGPGTRADPVVEAGLEQPIAQAAGDDDFGAFEDADSQMVPACPATSLLATSATSLPSGTGSSVSLSAAGPSLSSSMEPFSAAFDMAAPTEGVQPRVPSPSRSVPDEGGFGDFSGPAAGPEEPSGQNDFGDFAGGGEPVGGGPGAGGGDAAAPAPS